MSLKKWILSEGRKSAAAIECTEKVCVEEDVSGEYGAVAGGEEMRWGRV